MLKHYWSRSLIRLLLVGTVLLLVACAPSTSNQPSVTATLGRSSTTATPTATTVPAPEQFVVYTSGAKNLPDTINALRASDGTLLWHYATGGGAVRGLKIVDGVVYAGTYSGNVYALRLSDGKMLWQAHFDGILEWLDVANGVVYLNIDANSSKTSTAKTFFAFDALHAADGSMLWQHQLPGEFPSGTYVSFTTVLSNGEIYAALTEALNLGATDYTFDVYAFAGTDGHLLWNSTLSGSPTLIAPLVANGGVYVSAYRMNQNNAQGPDMAVLYAFQQNTGKLLWTYQDSGISSFHPQAVSNGTLYMEGSEVTKPDALESNYVLALRTSDGTQLWRDALTDANARNDTNIPTDLTVLHDVLYIGEMEEAPGGGMGRVLALHASDGKIIWHDDIAPIGITEVQVLVADDRVYVGQNEHMVSALRADTGVALWQHTFGDSESGAFKLAASNGMVYVGTYPDTGSGHSVCAMQATNGTQLWCHLADAGIIWLYGQSVENMG